MGIEYESVVDPGAMTRLAPPWQPMKVVAETGSLADGRAVLGLPGGLRWVTQHDPSGFDPPHRFVGSRTRAGPTGRMGQETAHQAADSRPDVVREFDCAPP
jgi:ligand-binding SRPBCC domain-containing protein